MRLRVIERLNINTSCGYECEDCEKYFTCTAEQKSNLRNKPAFKRAIENMKNVKNVILVLGGKGGVGKSMLATNLAAVLALRGRKTCILDSAFDTPAIAVMTGVVGQLMRVVDGKLEPCQTSYGLKVISMGNVLEKDDVLIWFHAMKRNAAEEFLGGVNYGELDYLIIDVPAGTSSETVNVIKLVPRMSGSVVITVPSEVSQNVARRAVLISHQAGVPVIGIVENMADFTCPHCSHPVAILQSGGGEQLARALGVPFLGSIPMDDKVSASLDEGEPFVLRHPDFPGTAVIERVADAVEQHCAAQREVG